MLLYATGLLIHRRLQAELRAMPAEVELVVLPPPCPLRVQPTDFTHADELIAQARRDTRRYLWDQPQAQVRRVPLERRRRGHPEPPPITSHRRG